MDVGFTNKHTHETKQNKTNSKTCTLNFWVPRCSFPAQQCWIRWNAVPALPLSWASLHQSDLSFFLPPPIGTLLATAEPTAVTPPATAHTPPLTSPTPITGTATTEVTAVLVRSRPFPPIQVTPPTVAPKAPLVAPYKPPANLPNMPGWATGWSLLSD